MKMQQATGILCVCVLLPVLSVAAVTQQPGFRAATLQPAPKQCTPPYVNIGNNCFYITPPGVKEPWIVARERCYYMNGYLAVLDTKEKNDALKEYLEKHKDFKTSLWIGLTDRAKEGKYTWDHTGLEATYEEVKRSNPFTRSTKDEEDCIKFTQENWKEEPCTDLQHYVCEEKSKPTCPKPYIALNTGCYNFVTSQKANFDAARNYCNKLNSTLVDLECDTENKEVSEYIFKSYSGHVFWIGAYNEGHPNFWYWSSNSEPIEYSKWMIGQPSHDVTKSCAASSGNGWFAEECDEDYWFICEKQPIL